MAKVQHYIYAPVADWKQSYQAQRSTAQHFAHTHNKVDVGEMNLYTNNQASYRRPFAPNVIMLHKIET